MFSVLIVDDEEPVLESYDFMLRAFSEGEGEKSPFTLAGKARTGIEALRLIHEQKPDLVFMDINIPGLDGLAVLEEVHKKYPNMVCILSTAYERFDIAKRAIPLGIFSYLVKPVSKNTFFSTLENALVQLRSLPPSNSEYSEPRLDLLRRDIWAVMDEQRWHWYREKLGLQSDTGFVLIMEIDEDMDIWAERIVEKILYRHHCIFDIMLHRGIFLISGSLSPDQFRKKTIKLLEELLGNLSFTYGLGGSYSGHLLYYSCTEALAELTKKKQGADTWLRLSKKVALLRQKIGLLPLDDTISLFSEIWEPLFSENFERAKIRMVSFFTLVLDDLFNCWSAPHLRNDSNDAPILPFDPAEIIKLPDLGAWKRWVRLNFDKLVLEANLQHQGNFPPSLLKALAFIKENYTKSIQLRDVADAASVNSAHLSRLFADRLKTNFIDYLTTLRVNEAERLLIEKPFSVKDAAFAVGYQDPNYFSKIFKKIRGILPTEVVRKN
ncbi:MAG: response regulator [Treponema sp.]|nr:response regulator [Treponema sp.]